MGLNRRDFIRNVTAGAAGVAAGVSLGGSAMGMPARSYGRVIGANDRLNVAVVGMGRRLKAYFDPISKKVNNIQLLYLCDVMKSQRESGAAKFSAHIDYDPKLENDIRKVIEDPEVDLIFNATPDHWHTPGTLMALAGGKHVYVEKPCTHNMHENDLLVAAQKKYNKVPNVKGMSGMDAISILENLGIKVEVHGNGTVKKQSIRHGTDINKVDEVVLDLS